MKQKCTDVYTCLLEYKLELAIISLVCLVICDSYQESGGE